MQTESVQRPRARTADRRGASRPPLDWRSPTRHLWVATRSGEYAGMTEYRRGRGFTTAGRTGRPLGTFRSLDRAMAALERER